MMDGDPPIVSHGAFLLLRDRDGRRHAVRRALVLGFSETEDGDVLLHVSRGSLVLGLTLEHALRLLALCP